MMSRKNIFSNVDWFTVFIYALIALFGWVNIYASLYDEAHQSILDFSQRYGKQLVWIGFAGVIAFFILLIDAKIYEDFSFVIYLSIILLLLGVLVFGTEIAGSKSWFKIGGIAIQPAEFAKFSTALALSKYIVERQVNLKKFSYLVKAVIIFLIPAVLILLQNDTGSALVFMAFVIVLFREGMSAALLSLIVSVGSLFFFTLLLGKWMVIYSLAGLTALIIII